MDKTNNRLWNLSIPTQQMRECLQELGFSIFTGSYHYDAGTESIVVRPPDGWEIEFGEVAKIVFDPENQPRFVDFLGSRDFRFGLIELEMPHSVLRRIEKSQSTGEGRVITSGIPFRDILRIATCALVYYNNPDILAPFVAKEIGEQLPTGSLPALLPSMPRMHSGAISTVPLNPAFPQLRA